MNSLVPNLSAISAVSSISLSAPYINPINPKIRRVRGTKMLPEEETNAAISDINAFYIN